MYKQARCISKKAKALQVDKYLRTAIGEIRLSDPTQVFIC